MNGEKTTVFKKSEQPMAQESQQVLHAREKPVECIMAEVTINPDDTPVSIFMNGIQVLPLHWWLLC